MKAERISAIDTVLAHMEVDLQEKGVTDEELEKYALYSALGLLGILENRGYTINEAIEKLTSLLQQKGGSVRETRS